MLVEILNHNPNLSPRAPDLDAQVMAIIRVLNRPDPDVQDLMFERMCDDFDVLQSESDGANYPKWTYGQP